MTIRIFLACVLLLVSTCSVTQTAAPAFDGVEKWKDSLSTAAIASLRDLYSTDPPAMFMAKGQKPAPGISPETEFWQNLITSGATDFDVQPVEHADRQGLRLVTLAVSMKMKTANGLRTRYVTEQQAWQQQAGGWRIVVAAHTDVVKMPPALSSNPNLYDKNANAKADIAEAMSKAKKKDRERVLLVFGANWCYDCHVLDKAFHQSDVAALLQENFQVVHVDIGDDGKKNNDVAAEYQVPLGKGIPAIAVLDSDGKLLYAQKNGEWESARSLDPDDVIAFLEKWKP
jgi:thiol-disulfide isomerase/thioredoxin